MKNRVYTHCFAALTLGVAVAFTSCNKVESDLPADDGTITIEFQQVDPETNADGTTRTEFHDNTIWWSAGDQLSYIQYALVNGTWTYKRTTTQGLSEAKEIISHKISSFNTPDDGTDSYYCSFYPAASYSAYSTSSGHVRVRIKTPGTQKPTNNSFDPAADLLISDYEENLTKTDGKYLVKLSYYRQVALGKMKLKNLPSDSQISSVEFSATHGESAVTLAGEKWYDFISLEPTTVYSTVNKLTLDYTGQSITGNNEMTAYFCCYPFELVAGDSFMVKVTTVAGEAFTRRVTIPDNRTLSFEADRGTQFTVDMSSAMKTDNRLTVNETISSNYTKTAIKVYFTVKSTVPNAITGAYKAVSEEAFADITDIGAYLDDNGTVFADTDIQKINAGTSLICSSSGLKADTWNVVMVKLVLDNQSEIIGITHIKTDWFSMTFTKRTAGGISFRYYGANLTSATCDKRIVATADLPTETTLEDYYTNTLAPGALSSETLATINSTGSTTAVYTTKYYTNESTQAMMTPGENYTVMVKAYNTRGESKFFTASADAGGSTE